MKLRTAFLIAFSLLIFSRSLGQQLNWEQIGPDGGVFSTILADSKGNFFICDGNLMYKSTNKGVDWNLVDVPLFGNEYRSIDKYFIHPSGKIFVFVDNPSTNDSAYCSDVNENNWNSIEALPQQINSKGDLYGIKPNGSLMISKDDGANWSSLSNFTKPIYNFYLYDDQRFLAVASDSTILTSVDAGKSWKINNLGFGLRDAQIIEDSKNNLYLLSYTRFRKSTDFGNTWTEINFPKASPFYHSIKNLQEKGIIVGEGNSFYKSMDEGKTWNIEWTFKNIVRDFLVDKAGNYLCSIDAEGIYRFNSFSNSWEKCNRGLFSYVSQISHFGSKLFVSHFSKIFNSPDLGFSWQDVSPSNYFWGATFHQSGVISAFLIGARIVISLDEGDSWREINNP
ncbi:MAG: hypothetical protein Q8K92_09465, partial [Leadbetterella sp.]|nr:hypothetical protein [Leadbetterella sp.]